VKKISLSPQVKIGILILLITIFGLALGLLARPSSQDFVDAWSVAPWTLIKKAMHENYAAVNGQIIRPKALNFTAEQDLYVFDFNTPNLCGIRGCLYAVYTGERQRVLSLYLRVNLPKSVKLFSTEGKQNGYPCLAITQFQLKTKRLVQTRYCYQGGVMIPVFQQLVENNKS